MKKELKYWTNWATTIVILFTFVSCELGFGRVVTPSSSTNVRSVVSRCIDQEISTILPYLDEETQITIESGSLTGEEIISRAMEEEDGEKYVDFCYAVQETIATQDTEYLLNSAKTILPYDKYVEIEQQVADIEHHLGDMTRNISRGLTPSDQEKFYSDLRALVVKTSVLLVAGIVFALMPKAVIWGKVSAAAAIAVGAGMVAGVVMDLYGHYRLGYNLSLDVSAPVSEQSFEDWLAQFKKEPEAYYAIATSIISIASSMELNPVATGIIMVVFAAYNVWDTIQIMKQTYNFDA